MKRTIATYLKHLILTVAVIVPAAVLFGLSQGAALHYGDDPQGMIWDDEGPYVFFESDGELNVSTVHGNKDDGFSLERNTHVGDGPLELEAHFLSDSTSFRFVVDTEIETPPASYADGQPIFAISDIESGYRGFRDMLVAAGVIDQLLDWSFDQGHLVLVGDFVDRGFSTTQVLWFIYKLEQEAKAAGGQVHFILGNHEIKNLQGNFESSSPKYFHVASILGRSQHDLYGPDSFLGRWMASKNTIERIDGHLFVHGGIHPEVVSTGLGLDEINDLVRRRYRQAFYPKPQKDTEQFFVSTHTGPSWYRGYFKDDLSQDQVEEGLEYFGSSDVVVGHTIQSKVSRHFEGRVIAIDVKHPNDYHKNWPTPRSEALLIEGDAFWRVLDSGEKVRL